MNLIIISLKINLFSPWYIWKTYISYCYFFVTVTVSQSRCGQLLFVLCCYINVQLDSSKIHCSSSQSSTRRKQPMKSVFKYNPHKYSNKLYWVKSIHSKNTSVSEGKTLNKKINLLQIQIIFLFIRISEYYNIKYEFNNGWKCHSATHWLYIPVGGVEGQWINIRVIMYYTSLFHRIFSLSAHLTRKIISGECLSSLGIYHPSLNFPHFNLIP